MLSKQTIPAWVCHPSPRPGKAPSRQACWHLIQEGQILTEGQNVSPTLGFNNQHAQSSHSKTFSGNSHYPLLTCLKVRQLLSWVQEEKNTFKPVTLYTKWCIGWWIFPAFQLFFTQYRFHHMEMESPADWSYLQSWRNVSMIFIVDDLKVGNFNKHAIENIFRSTFVKWYLWWRWGNFQLF